MASTDIFNRKASVPDWMAKWWEFDQAFSAKVMAGNWRNMTEKQAIYGGIQGFLVLAVAACGAVSKNQKSTELPSMGQPTIGLITEASAGSDLLLNQQLAGVKTLSGRADCLPQLVAIDGGNLGAETVGLCQVNTKDGQGTEVIVRKQKGGDQQTIKQMLTARTSPETLYFEYGSGDQKETLFKYDVASGGTEWVLPDGKTIEFKKGQSPFEEMIGKILEPGNVAQAAEATCANLSQIDFSQEKKVLIPTDRIPPPGYSFYIDCGSAGVDLLNANGQVKTRLLPIPWEITRNNRQYEFNGLDETGAIATYEDDNGLKVYMVVRTTEGNNKYLLQSEEGEFRLGTYSNGKWNIQNIISSKIEINNGQARVFDDDGKDFTQFAIGVNLPVPAVTQLMQGTAVQITVTPKGDILVATAVPAPTTTVEQGEGGLPVGAVRFDEGGIKGIRSPVPIPGYEPRFSNGYAVLDCRVNQSCSEIKPFNSLQEAQEYWKKIYPNAMFKYEYWLFDDGGIARVLVELVGIGN